jgi:hypothetical protein
VRLRGSQVRLGAVETAAPVHPTGSRRQIRTVDGGERDGLPQERPRRGIDRGNVDTPSGVVRAVVRDGGRVPPLPPMGAVQIMCRARATTLRYIRRGPSVPRYRVIGSRLW